MAEKQAVNWSAVVQSIVEKQGFRGIEYTRVVRKAIKLAARNHSGHDKTALKSELKSFLDRSSRVVVEGGMVTLSSTQPSNKRQAKPAASDPMSAVTTGTHAAATALELLGSQPAKKRKKLAEEVEQAANGVTSLKHTVHPAAGRNSTKGNASKQQQAHKGRTEAEGPAATQEKEKLREGENHAAAMGPEHHEQRSMPLIPKVDAEQGVTTSGNHHAVDGILISQLAPVVRYGVEGRETSKKRKIDKTEEHRRGRKQGHDGKADHNEVADVIGGAVPLIKATPASDVLEQPGVWKRKHRESKGSNTHEATKANAVDHQGLQFGLQLQQQPDDEQRVALKSLIKKETVQTLKENPDEDERQAKKGKKRNEMEGNAVTHAEEQEKQQPQQKREKGQQHGGEGQEHQPQVTPQPQQQPQRMQQTQTQPASHTAVLPPGASSDAKRWREANKREDVKSGPFSQAEKDILKQAVVEYAEQHGHSTGDFSWLFGRTQKRSKRNEGAWAVIAEALPQRTYKSVWAAGTRMFHPGNYQGRFSLDEDARLQHLVQERGNKWKEIGAALGRMPGACRDRWKEIRLGSERNAGTWSEEETKKLVEAVEEYLAIKKAHMQPNSRAAEQSGEVAVTLEGPSQQTPRPSSGDRPLFDGNGNDSDNTSSEGGDDASTTPSRRQVLDDIDWHVVSKRVGTRSDIQCLEKWYSQLCPSMVERGEWGSGDDRRLLRAINASGAAQDYELDWGALVPGRDAAQARRRWRLMLKCVPGSRNLDFSEVVDYLVGQYMPHLKKQQEGQQVQQQ